MTRIAIISDIHGNLPALQAVLADIAGLGACQIVNCGDTLAGPLEAAQTADLLMARRIPMIAGNHERQMLSLPVDRLSASDRCALAALSAGQRAWLATAPPTLWLNSDARENSGAREEIFICHGTPHSDLHGWLETVTPDYGLGGSLGVRAATPAEVMQRLGTGRHAHEASLIACGHTHTPRVVTLVSPTDGHLITIVNPGSVGLPAYDDLHPHRHHIETGSPHARYAVAEQTGAGWQIDLRRVMYDFERMARLAEQRERPDWAVALRTERMV